MTIPIFHVDAFSAAPFAGNPAAVCLLETPAQAAWMQHVAAEMNLSETAFVAPDAQGYSLRWFTPACEVDLCGHATLASAHVLYERGAAQAGKAVDFYTASGTLTARRSGGWIEMDFPAEAARQSAACEGLFESLGIGEAAGAAFVGRNRFDYIIELSSEAALRALSPDWARLLAVKTRGVIVTSPSSDDRYDFVSRFFCPAVGVNEDPVTGSAHCCLGPYWQGRLGKSELTGYQASARGGVVRVRVCGPRVMLIGQAVTVTEGVIL
ncbi:MAG: PhzF family phenazine biosynthesis protein [Planctomycetaceae bacterium]|nr:PhzF family phenazine biosynthesis protein [Planctomycetaceae bacterium]